MQAIDWTATRLRREDYRAERLRTYQNYRSMSGGSDKETGADVIEVTRRGLWTVR